MSTNTALATREQSQQQEQGDEPKGLALYQGYGALTEPARAAMDRSRALRKKADMIATTAWGAQLAPALRAAMAEWCEQNDVDPIEEIDNVGGPYVNSAWSLRKMGELRTRGIIRDVAQRHIGADKRLAALAKDQDAPEEVREAAKREHYERLNLRIAHGVPEEAAAAHVTLIYLAAGGDPIVGVKWGGNGTSIKQSRSGGGSAPNPIVENNPTLSVESQSVHRAMRALRQRVPGALPDPDKMQEGLEVLRASARTDYATHAAELAASKPRALAAGAGSYGDDEPPVGVVQPVDDDAYGAPAHADAREED